MISKTSSPALFALMTILALVSAEPAYAGMCAGTSPGASPSTLPPSFVDTGSGFYRGMIENIFVKVFASSAGITAMDVIYSNDDGPNLDKIPQNLCRQITLAEAVKVHSFSQAAPPTFFGYARSASTQTMVEANQINRQYGLPALPIPKPRIYGIVDVDNQIVYTTSGVLSPDVLVTSVSYVLPHAPVIKMARQMPIEPPLSAFFFSTQTASGKIVGESSNVQTKEDRTYLKSAPPDLSGVKMPTKMKDCLSVKVLDKKFEKGEILDKITVKLSYRNLTPKAIRGFKGTVIFKDMFGDPIKAVGFKVDEVLPALTERSEVRNLDFNRFRTADGQLLTTSVENMTVDWQPEMIIFTDGTSVRKQLVPK